MVHQAVYVPKPARAPNLHVQYTTYVNDDQYYYYQHISNKTNYNLQNYTNIFVDTVI